MRFVVTVLTVAILLAGRPAHAAALWTFDVIPSDGALGALPGETVGWGYEISNLDSMNWLVVSALNEDAFQFGATDSSMFDFPILSPGATVSLPYEPGTHGLFAFTWDATAPAGFANAGSFTLSADWYDGDPFTTGSYLGAADDASAAYSVAVQDATGPAPVPEPASLVLLGSGVVGLVARRRHQKRKASR